MRWGDLAVQVEVEVVRPEDDPGEPCLGPETVGVLDDVARKAQEGEVPYFRQVGPVYRAVSRTVRRRPGLGSWSSERVPHGEAIEGAATHLPDAPRAPECVDTLRSTRFAPA